MKKTLSSFVCIYMLMLATRLFANGVSPLQLLYVVKQVFPDQEQVTVFISKGQFAELEEKINRAAAQSHLKVQVCVVESSSGIGSMLSSMERNSVLVLLESDLLLNSTTKLYILSKCKEKQIAIVTSSKTYSDSGALVAVIKRSKRQADTYSKPETERAFEGFVHAGANRQNWL